MIKDGLSNKGVPRRTILKITKDEFVKWYLDQDQKCLYCGRTLEQSQTDTLNKKTNRLTIDRLDNNRGYEKGNLALSCLRCNAIKNNYFTKDEMLIIGRVIRDKEFGQSKE